MKNSLITIVIPVYNGESKICYAINSLKNQTFKDFEVLVIDDGSIDNTESVIEEYTKNDKRFKYIYKKNGGVSSARNLGIQVAKGKYISFLDCDDYYDIKFLEKMYKKIECTSADLCYCGYNTFSPSGINRVKTQYKMNNALKEYLLGKLKLQTACFLIKKEVIEKNNLEFRIGADWGEDYEFFCKLLKHSKKITYLKEYLVYYNVKDMNDKLSRFNIQQVEKNMVMIENIKRENLLTTSEKKALINYLAPALIINFLYYNFNKIDPTVVRKIILQNKEYIDNMKFVNGLRSIKIYILFQKIKREVLR